MWTISSGGSPSPRTRSAAVVTVDRSTLSGLTGTVGGRYKAVRRPCGLWGPMSFKVASKVMAMRGGLKGVTRVVPLGYRERSKGQEKNQHDPILRPRQSVPGTAARIAP